MLLIYNFIDAGFSKITDICCTQRACDDDELKPFCCWGRKLLNYAWQWKVWIDTFNFIVNKFNLLIMKIVISNLI